MTTQTKHICLSALNTKKHTRVVPYTTSFHSFIFLGLLLMFTLLSTNLASQYTYELDKTTRFDKMGVEEGLSTEYTKCIHQDKYGFIWIGTQRGLNLYDGYSVQNFYADHLNPNALPDDYINSIFEDDEGSMWFCTRLGISKYNRSNQTFTNYIPDTVNINNRTNYATRIVQQDSNFLWVDTNFDLFLFNKETGQFKSFAKNTSDPFKGIYGRYTRYAFIDKAGIFWYVSGESGETYALSKFNKELQTFTHFVSDPDDPESFANFDVNSMIEDKNGTIWIATNGGGLLEFIDKEEGKFRRYLHDDSDTNSIHSNRLIKIFEDAKGYIWVGGNSGFSHLNKENARFTNYRVPNRKVNPNWVNVIKNITDDDNGDLWLTTYEGFFRFNPITGKLSHYRHDQDNQNSLSGNNIKQVIIDQAGQTWTVGGNTGVDRINQFSNIFRKIRKKNHIKNSLSSNYIGRFLVDSRNHFWIGCYDDGGLNRTKMNKDRVFDTFEHFKFDVNNPRSISSNTVNTIYEDHDQIIWSGGWRGLDKYDELSNSFTHFQHDPDDSTTLSDNRVEVVFEDSFGTFWVGTRNGLNIMDKETGEFIRILPNENGSSSISSSDIREIYEDSYGELWIGGSYLEKLNRMDTSFTIYPLVPNYTDLYISSFGSIKEDDSSNLWVATRGGILHWRRHSNSFEFITGEQGLSSDYLVDLEIDDQGNIWVCSNRGLSRVNPKTRHIRNFDIEDGLISLEIIDRSLFKDTDGWLYFGTRDGFNYFHPDSIKENTCIPPVYITALTVAGQPKYFDQPLYELENIELNYNENDLSFDFVALNYINTQKNQYAFMLEGYDEDWNYVGNRRAAYYTNLNPGDYVFRVKGSNNDGYWNEEGASLMLTIHPPFWATIWAYLAYVAIFFGLLYLFRRYELNRLYHKQNAEIEQVNRERLSDLDIEKNKFFSNISHEFRTPITLILGPLERIIRSQKNNDFKQELMLVRRNARRLQTLINQLLSLSKLESGKMQLKARPENVVKLSSLFLQSFNSMAEDKQIKLEFETDAEEHIVYIDTLKIEKVANNLLSNAFKFTEKGGKIKVGISAVTSEGNDVKMAEHDDASGIVENIGVCIKVSDTGIGIRKEKLPHVFDRFYQVDEVQMKTYFGTGIGLALTKELIELHHGTISADSEPGMGTTFTIFLPSGKDHLKEDEILATSTNELQTDDEQLEDDYLFVQSVSSKADRITVPAVNGNQPIILIVEDNDDMRSYIKSYLTDSYNIIEATNGKEGAKMAIEHVPDLIVSDLMMPFVDGAEMTIQLKADERTSHIPIVLLTAKASIESKLAGLGTGADDFLTKPFNADELLIRIKNLIEQRKRLRKLLFDHIGDKDQTRLIHESFKGMTKMDEQFLEKANTIIGEKISDPDFSVELLANEMAMSRVQLHRKLKSLTDHSASDLIRDIRLMKAAELLAEGDLNVTQVSYEIGISSLSYFAKAFKEKYGVTPSEYA